jgi:hypothetical protein
MNDTYRELARATEAIAKNMGIRFCTKCNLTRPVEGGRSKLLSNGRTRWECSYCVSKRTKGFMKGPK